MDFESLTLTITSDTIKDNVPVTCTLVLRGCDKDKKLLTTAVCRSGTLEARKELYIQAFPEYLKRTVVTAGSVRHSAITSLEVTEAKCA